MNLFLNTPWPFLATAIFIALLGFYAWKQPRRPGTGYFFWILGLWLISTLAATLTPIAQTTKLRYALWVIQCVGVLSISAMNLIFSLEYTGNVKWLNRRNLILLFLPAFIFGLLSITLPMNDIATVHVHFGINVIIGNELIRWILFAINSSMWMINVGVLAGSLLRSPAFSATIGLFVFGQSIPLIAFAVIDPDLIVASPIQFSILFSNFTCLTYFVSLYNFRLLRVVPMAWDQAIGHLPYSMLVLDADDFLVAFNSAAQALPGLPGKLALRHTASDSLGEWWDRISPSIGSERITQDIVVQTSAGQQHFQMQSLPLLHVSGWRMGQVLILEDVTQSRQVQELHTQTLWAQATLQERELLANELHDGLSQSLAFLNLQAQAAHIQIQTGQRQAAQASLDRLTEAASELQENTRELIGSLLSISLPTEDFQSTLCQILDHFEQQTGLSVHLRMDGDVAADDFFAPSRLPPLVAAQLVRMTQEALANVRKHSPEASQVNVQLNASQGQLHLTIEDDGTGFDPVAIPEGGKKFGLQIMRQRAARIGGQIAINSEPGKGTRIEICAPISSGVEA